MVLDSIITVRDTMLPGLADGRVQIRLGRATVLIFIAM